MDQTVQKIVGAIQIEVRKTLQGLGDYPKSEQFEHGVQVGHYRGLSDAITIIERVLNDEAEAEQRR